MTRNKLETSQAALANMTESDPPAPPAGQSKQGRAVWDRVLYQLGSTALRQCDQATIKRYCDLTLAYEGANSFLAKNGYFYSAGNQEKTHPVFEVLKFTHNALSAIEAKLGMTPAARSKLKLPEAEVIPDDWK